MKLFVSGIAVALIAAPALAEDRATTAQERAEGRRVLTEFANCTADAVPELAARYAGSDEWVPEADWKQLVDNRCMKFNTGKLRMDAFYFRGALAQRLLAKRNHGADDFSAVAPIAWTAPGDEAGAIERNYALRVGECIARRSPAAARSLFSKKVDSEEERAAFAALGPVLASCVPAGEQVRINRTNLRVGMATAYLRLVQAGTS